MNMNNIKKYTIWLLSFCLVGCDEFLDVRPSENSQVEIETAEQLDALLGNYDTFFTEKNLESIIGNDDCGLDAELFKEESQIFQHSYVFHMVKDIEGMSNDSFEQNWQTEYKKIFNANLVLDNLSKVSGDQALKDRLRREAHFIKAVSYYQLVNYYTMLDLPENQNEPGLILKKTTSFEESIPRATIAETYKQIEMELSEALQDKTPIIKNGKFRPWRISEAGVKAFAARYYLQKSNYALALNYANEALNLHSSVVDYNTELSFKDKPYIIKVGDKTINMYVPSTWNSTDGEILRWKESLYSRVLYNGSNWTIPSKELMDLYDKAHDLRYKYIFIKDYSYYVGAKKVSHPGYSLFGSDILSGPSVPEMILIKAECLVRQGKWSEGMQVLETLRVNRIERSGYQKLVATNQQEALKQVLEERRRELPFTLRWFDIRRFNQNQDPSDNVDLVKMFYPYNVASVDFTQPLKEYKLSGNSRKWAMPIPRREIISGQGKIRQNEY